MNKEGFYYELPLNQFVLVDFQVFVSLHLTASKKVTLHPNPASKYHGW
jgi:hypothetical protein